MPNANAQVIENLGMYSALMRKPIMLKTRKLVLSGAIFAIGLFKHVRVYILFWYANHRFSALNNFSISFSAFMRFFGKAASESFM